VFLLALANDCTTATFEPTLFYAFPITMRECNKLLWQYKAS